jgi:hypothetical protein
MLRDSYIKEAYMKARKVGDFANIGDIIQDLLIEYDTSEKKIKKALLRLFYIEKRIDLAPGKSDYIITDANDNKFAYMKWKKNGHISDNSLKESVDSYNKKLEELITQLHTYDFNDNELKRVWSTLQPNIDKLEDTKKLIREKLGII